MRIAVLSDIHANQGALESVLRDVEKQAVDYMACLGDVVGYGPQPNECCDLVRQYADVTVVGNHDAAVAGRMDYTCYRLAAREALDLHRSMLTPENLEWLNTLPYSAELEDLLFCHGAPPALEAFDYLFTLKQVAPLVREHAAQAKVTFIGHSHLCKTFGFNANRAKEILRTRFELEPEEKYISSVGSVGQPRDYDSRACWCLVDTETMCMEYRRVLYDVESTAKLIFKLPLAPAFGQRLMLGI